jgi:hypothetical protein
MANDYVATHENEWNGVLYSDDEWATYLTNAVDAQRQALADAISYASNRPDGSNWDAIYSHLSYVGTQGGNADFGCQPTASDGSILTLASLQLSISGIDAQGCEWSCRDGSMPSLHYNNDAFHLDTANPTLDLFGLLVHGFVDVVLGNINPSVPMIP